MVVQIGGYCTCCLSQQQLHFIIIWTFDVFLMMALTGVAFYARMQAQTLPPAHLQKNQHEHVIPYGIIICVYMTYFNTCVSAPSEWSLWDVSNLLFVRYSRPSSMHICMGVCVFWGVGGVLDSSVHNAVHYKQQWLLKITAGFCIFTCLVTCD